MLALNDYIAVIEDQQETLRKFSNHFRLLHFFFPKLLFVRLRFALHAKKSIDRIKKKSLSVVLQATGLLAYIESEQESFKGKDLSDQVTKIEGVLKEGIELRSLVEETFSEVPSNKFLGLKACYTNLDNGIETYYTILRLLKRLNQHKSIETTQLAIDLSNHSLHTLANRGNAH